MEDCYFDPKLVLIEFREVVIINILRRTIEFKNSNFYSFNKDTTDFDVFLLEYISWKKQISKEKAKI